MGTPFIPKRTVFYEGPLGADAFARTGEDFYPEIKIVYDVLNAVRAPSGTIGVMLPFKFYDKRDHSGLDEGGYDLLRFRPNDHLTVYSRRTRDHAVRRGVYKNLINPITASATTVVLGTTGFRDVPCISLDDLIFFAFPHRPRITALRRLAPLKEHIMTFRPYAKSFSEVLDGPEATLRKFQGMCPVWIVPACLAQFEMGMWADLAHRQVHAQLRLNTFFFPGELERMPPVQWKPCGNVFIHGPAQPPNDLHNADLNQPEITLLTHLKNRAGLPFGAMSILVPIRAFIMRPKNEHRMEPHDAWDGLSLFFVQGSAKEVRQAVRGTMFVDINVPSYLLLTARPEAVTATNGSVFVCPVVPLATFRLFVPRGHMVDFQKKICDANLGEKEWVLRRGKEPVVPIWAVPRVLGLLWFGEFEHEWNAQIRAQLVNRRSIYPSGWLEMLQVQNTI